MDSLKGYQNSLVHQSYVLLLSRVQTIRNELMVKHVRSSVTRRSFFVSHSVVHVLSANFTGEYGTR